MGSLNKIATEQQNEKDITDTDFNAFVDKSLFCVG